MSSLNSIAALLLDTFFTKMSYVFNNFRKVPSAKPLFSEWNN